MSEWGTGMKKNCSEESKIEWKEGESEQENTKVVFGKSGGRALPLREGAWEEWRRVAAETLSTKLKGLSWWIYRSSAHDLMKD